MFPADGIAGVPRRPRTGVRKRGGDCWSEVVKRAKLAVNGNPGPTPRRQRHRQAVAAEQETEQEVAEALFNLASGGVGSSYQAEQAGERVKTEEPLPRNRSGSHGGRGQGRGNGDRRKQPREVEDARQWAANDATNVQGHIATPKAVKPSTSSAAVGPSMPLPALPVSGGANIGLGMGLGAFAGTFANGLNGSYYSPSAANAAAAAQVAAAAQAQSALWPPSFPGQGREEAGEPSTSGQEVLMPPQRRNWKRCASHVYIAHFIEYQIHKDRLQKQQRQALRALGADAAASPDLLRANGAAAATPPDAAGRPPAAEVHNAAASSAGPAQPLPLLNGSQAMANGAYQFSQPTSAPLAAAGLGRPGQQNGFPPQFAQQLQNHLLLQQSGAFPFLPPGMQHLGGQFLGGANGGLTPQQAAALQQASSFPFPASAHMLGLAGFGNLSQQLNGANGLAGGFGPRKIDIKDGLSGDVAALKRAAAVTGMKPEDVLKLGLPSMTTPEAAARLHALGVPSAMLNGRQPPNGVPPAMTMAGFHEQLLAAAAQQRPESQGISLLR